MKNVSKNNKKFSSCFRPVVNMDAMLDSRAAVPVPHKHHTSISDTKSVFLEKDSIVHHPPKRTFSLVIKAVVFETILNRGARPRSRHGLKHRSAGDERTILSQASVDSNIRETKLESPLSSSVSRRRILSRLGETKRDAGWTQVGSIHMDPTPHISFSLSHDVLLSSSQGSASSCSSPSSSSQGSASSCSSAVLESKNLSTSYSNKPRHRESRRQGKSERQKKLGCFGIYLVLVSLTFTVIWGKYWGAFLTSTWLYFFSLSEASYRQTKEVAKLSKTESQV